MKSILSVVIILVVACATRSNLLNTTRQERALQKEHEKPQEEKWLESFIVKEKSANRVASLRDLLLMVAKNYLSDCTTILLYDELSQKTYPNLLDKLLETFPGDFVLGQINDQYKPVAPALLDTFFKKCVNYILFVYDIMKCKHLIGIQHTNKVVIVSASSQWRVHEFLHSDISHGFVNVLVITQSDKIVAEDEELPFILYTHNLYSDGLGASTPSIITSWTNKSLTRPHQSLFPQKFTRGFSGHRFIISVAEQPPFVIKREMNENGDYEWDGVEIRLVSLLGEIYNFTTDFREAPGVKNLGPTDAIMEQIVQKKANLGMSGIYITDERISAVEMSQAYTQDCASFISLTSTAMPRWRAIMGPFRWTVWLSVTLIYLMAIFPLSFSDRHSLRHLCEKPEEIESMFWYVYGTFTNCFTFKEQMSWTQSDKYATRLLIGFYWLFTIIITSCYTGSIIAFVTLPSTPETIDTAKQFLSGHYQIGTLDKGGWEHWFNDTSDPVSRKLMENIDLVPTIEEGLKNTTKAFFWPYAFLGSKAQLAYKVRTSFSIKNKRALLHIAKECFVPFSVSIIFNKNENYKEIINTGLTRAVESGFLKKFMHDVEWDMIRKATGKLLQANSGSSPKILRAEDRALTLKDTEGMFLLLGFGILLGAASLLSEWLGGCFNFCKRRRFSSSYSISSDLFLFNEATPRQKLDSLVYQQNLSEIATIEKSPNSEGNNQLTTSDTNSLKQENIEEMINMNFKFIECSLNETKKETENFKEDDEK